MAFAAVEERRMSVTGSVRTSEFDSLFIQLS